jgi:hypothetical protein
VRCHAPQRNWCLTPITDSSPPHPWLPAAAGPEAATARPRSGHSRAGCAHARGTSSRWFCTKTRRSCSSPYVYCESSYWINSNLQTAPSPPTCSHRERTVVESFWRNINITWPNHGAIVHVGTGKQGGCLQRGKRAPIHVGCHIEQTFFAILKLKIEPVSLKSRVSAISHSFQYLRLAPLVVFPQGNRLIDVSHKVQIITRRHYAAARRLSYGICNPSCSRFTICKLSRRLRFNTSETRPLEPM